MRKAVLNCVTLFRVDLFLGGSGWDLTKIFLKLRWKFFLFRDYISGTFIPAIALILTTGSGNPLLMGINPFSSSEEAEGPSMFGR